MALSATTGPVRRYAKNETDQPLTRRRKSPDMR